MKGNVDATLEILQGSGNHLGVQLAPFELKTGNREHISHQTQIILYNMLLSDKYDKRVNQGLLTYIKKDTSKSVEATPYDMASILNGRNKLADYLMSDKMPLMLQNESVCGRCFSKDVCMTYHKAVENGTSQTAGVGQLFESITAKLDKKAQAFIKKWNAVITLEERQNFKSMKDIWNIDESIRQKSGTCLNDLVIVNEALHDGPNGIRKLEYTLKKQGESTLDLADFLLDQGDPVMVTRKGHVSPEAVGYINFLGNDFIQVSVDRELKRDLKRQPLLSIPRSSIKTINSVEQLGENVFTLDKDAFSAGLSQVRNNLFDLFRNPECANLKKKVVDLEAPAFDAAKGLDCTLPKEANRSQRHAITKVMSCLDYTLLLGMPGTGKTTTLVHTIISLLNAGKSILLTSYTHSAVDNVILKLAESNVGFVRLGSVSKMHKDIKEMVLKQKSQISDYHSLSNYYNSAQLIATTALGMGHPIFCKRRFDYCIVDESSQMALPICLGPLKYADRFVLVGDHYQLPPLFGQKGAKQEPEPSLFKLLCQSHPSAVVTLNEQYRMNQDIMTLSNHLIYDYRLLCGTPSIARGQVSLTNYTEWEMEHSKQYKCGHSCWFKKLLDPNAAVLFVNTDAIEGLETKVGPFIENAVEADLIFNFCKMLVAAGIQEHNVGIISPYRHQLKRLQRIFAPMENVEVQTIDKFQGRDKDCIILSMTRSNQQKNVLKTHLGR